MTKYIFRFIVVTSVVACHLQCSYVKAILGWEHQKPKLSLKDIKVKSLDFNTLNLLLTIEVDNPNDFEINLSNMQYQLVMFERQIAKGEYKESVIILPEQTTSVDLPVDVDSKTAQKVFRYIFSHPDEQVFAYLNAKADFKTPVGRYELSYQDKKSLNVRSLRGK